jgi:hypothetical protein
MTTQQIIEDIFRVYTDDSSELSSTQELALANRVYKKICRNRPWEFLKKTTTGTTSTSVPYVSLPTRFLYMAENNQSQEVSENITNAKVVFVGTDYDAYNVVNFSDRRKYRDKDGYCYVDLTNSRLVFTKQPTAAESYEFDYIEMPADLTLATSPVFPSDFHDIIGYGMAVDSMIIQLFPKAQSYAAENQTKFNEGLKDLAYYNSTLQVNG